MKEEILLMQQLFDRYKISSPLDRDIQKYSLRMKRKNLNAILKKLGLHSTIYSAVVITYFLFKKLGIGLSIAQSAAVLFVASAVTSAAITAGGAIAVKKYVIERSAVQKLTEDKLFGGAGAVNAKLNSKHKKARNADVIDSLAFLGFTSQGIDKALIDEISGIMINQIIQTKGTGVVRPDANYALSGSIEKLNDIYLLSVRLIDRMNRKIVFASSGEAVTVEELKEAAKKISIELSKKINI